VDGAGRLQAKAPAENEATTEEHGLHAAHKLNGPTFAHAILTTAELIAALPKS